MDMTFAFLEGYEGLTVTQPAKEETEPKPPAEVPPFWWEDYNGRPGKPVNPDAAMAAVRAKCRDYRSESK